MSDEKKIEIVNGSGDLDISPVSEYIEIEKPKPKGKDEIVIPEEKKALKRTPFLWCPFFYVTLLLGLFLLLLFHYLLYYLFLSLIQKLHMLFFFQLFHLHISFHIP